MPEVARQGDICTGHSCFPPRQNTTWSGNVYVNGRAAHRQNDGWSSHSCPNTSHSSRLARGSSTVFVNDGAPIGGDEIVTGGVGRIGDPVKCGSAVATGSGNVFAGG
jgi:uncharacterized Zn-binding protein involved in type VI secretion